MDSERLELLSVGQRCQIKGEAHVVPGISPLENYSERAQLETYRAKVCCIEHAMKLGIMFTDSGWLKRAVPGIHPQDDFYKKVKHYKSQKHKE